MVGYSTVEFYLFLWVFLVFLFDVLVFFIFWVKVMCVFCRDISDGFKKVIFVFIICGVLIKLFNFVEFVFF